MDDLQEAFDKGFLAVKQYVDTKLLDFERRFAVLEARQPIKGDKGEDGRDGRDGKDADPEMVREIIKVEYAPVIEARTVSPDAIARIEQLIERDRQEFAGKLAELSDTKAEEKPAEIDAGAVIDLLIPEVVKWLEDNKPKDGRDGADGKDGAPGERGEKGEPGADGLAGRDGLPGLAGRDGKDGEKGEPGRDGKDGADGLNGKDGLGFDDLSVEFDGERTVTLKFQRGEELKAFPVKLPITIDRGVWTERSYEQGDVCTWGGSAWVAQRDTKAKPETNGDWRLMVRRGRDGRPGKDGERGPEGKKGEQGPIGPRGFTV